MKRRLGLFLGAGASYELAMPLAWDLTGELKTWLTAPKLREFNNLWRLQGGGYADAVIEDFLAILHRPEIHYEAALGHLETQFRRGREYAVQYHGMYSWLVDVVYHLLYARQISNNHILQNRLPDYDGLAVLTRDSEPLWIFSLNHDVIIEVIAARSGIPLHCGFSPATVSLPRRNPAGARIGELRAEVITAADLDHSAMYFPNPLQPGIYLLKIHGALDQFTFNEGKDLLRILPTANGYPGVLDALRVVNEELFYPHPGALGGRAKATNEICYADDTGKMQFLRRSLLAGAHKFDARQQQVLPRSLMKHFQTHINFVSELACIGYSFGDAHINEILRQWLDFSSDRRLEIVDPRPPKTLPPFLLHLAPQVKVTKIYATDYLDLRAGITRTRLEMLDRHTVRTLRVMGKDQSSKVLSAVLADEQRRISSGFIDRMKALPLKDGKPDFESLGDVKATAEAWASELKLSKEEFLLGLLDRAEASVKSSADA